MRSGLKALLDREPFLSNVGEYVANYLRGKLARGWYYFDLSRHMPHVASSSLPPVYRFWANGCRPRSKKNWTGNAVDSTHAQVSGNDFKAVDYLLLAHLRTRTSGTGPVPPELGKLEALQTLNIEGNELIGEQRCLREDIVRIICIMNVIHTLVSRHST